MVPVSRVIVSVWRWFKPPANPDAVWAVIASPVAASREVVLLRLALSLTASLSYLSPARQYAEHRLGKHDVAVSPKLFGLIKIPTGTLVFNFTALEDIAHTVK